jgi:hypothetical protein
VQAHRAARRIGKGVGVAPDLFARAVHAGMFVAMPENGFATLLRSPTGVRKIDGYVFLRLYCPTMIEANDFPSR